MEIKTIEIDEGYPLQVVTKRVVSHKPIYNNKGERLLKDCLIYLCRVLPQNEPTLNVLFGLASYSLNNNGLTEKQAKLANKFIKFWTEKGVL